MGFTLSSDGKIVVEEGVLRDATVSCGIGGFRRVCAWSQIVCEMGEG